MCEALPLRGVASSAAGRLALGSLRRRALEADAGCWWRCASPLARAAPAALAAGRRAPQHADTLCDRSAAASMAAVLAGLKSVDFYRKLKRDLQQELTEASIAGAALVVCSCVCGRNCR